MRPSALLRSISRNRLFLISDNCFPCLTLALRVLLLCCVDAAKNVLKCSGPLFNTQRWMSPSIAISRLDDRGAKLKLNKASSSDTLSSRRNFCWNASRGARTVSHADKLQQCGIPNTRAAGSYTNLQVLHP